MAFRHAIGSDHPRRGLWEIDGRVLFRRETSVLFSDGRRTCWLPKAKVIIEDLPPDGHRVAMPDWLARERGFV